MSEQPQTGISIIRGFTLPETLYLTAFFNRLNGRLKEEDAVKMLSAEYLRLIRSWSLRNRDVWIIFLRYLWRVIEEATRKELKLPEPPEEIIDIKRFLYEYIYKNPEFIKILVKDYSRLEKSAIKKRLESFIDSMILEASISTFMQLGGIKLLERSK